MNDWFVYPTCVSIFCVFVCVSRPPSFDDFFLFQRDFDHQFLSFECMTRFWNFLVIQNHSIVVKLHPEEGGRSLIEC